jgi:FkbM family methyltransferase
MILKTRALFLRLLRAMQVDVVCDVGSMNGAEALAFRQALPRAKVLAFEAHPDNLRQMQADPALCQQRIEVVPKAVTNYTGQAEFFVVKADDPTKPYRGGMSSLYARPDEPDLQSVTVETTRLDAFLADRLKPDSRLALWIDVEGKAYEVLEGASGLVQNLVLIHVETETQPCIAPGQKLHGDVVGLLDRLGFEQLAWDNPLTTPQLNVIFVRRDLPKLMRLRVKLMASCGAVRYSLRAAARRLWHRVRGR